MSLSHSKYLRTLDSEKRTPAIFATTQQQLNRIREDIRLLFDTVEKILDIQENHEKEHASMYRDAQSTTTPVTTPPIKDIDDKHSPYV